MGETSPVSAVTPTTESELLRCPTPASVHPSVHNYPEQQPLTSPVGQSAFKMFRAPASNSGQSTR